MMKETAFRPVEVRRLTPNDVDLERRVVTLNTPAKHSKPRQFRMSSQLTAMLTPMVRGVEPHERIWGAKASSIRRQFCLKRKALAGKLGDPKLLKISMRTFRHWKATMEYHRTKDILYVKELLGHHSIKNTLVNTHLVQFEGDDLFIVKVAKSLDEFSELLELGFDYVTD
jgi:integrase